MSIQKTEYQHSAAVIVPASYCLGQQCQAALPAKAFGFTLAISAGNRARTRFPARRRSSYPGQIRLADQQRRLTALADLHADHIKPA